MFRAKYSLIVLIIALSTMVRAEKHFMHFVQNNQFNFFPYNVTTKLMSTRFNTTKNSAMVTQAKQELFGQLRTKNTRVNYLAQKAAESYAAWINLLNTFEQPDAMALMNTRPEQLINMVLFGSRETDRVQDNNSTIHDPKFHNVKLSNTAPTDHEFHMMTRSIMIGVLLDTSVMKSIYRTSEQQKIDTTGYMDQYFKNLFGQLVKAKEQDNKYTTPRHIQHAAMTMAIILETLGQYYNYDMFMYFFTRIFKKHKDFYNETGQDFPKLFQQIKDLMNDNKFKDSIADNLEVVNSALNRPKNLKNLLTDTYKVFYIPEDNPYINVPEEKQKLQHARTMAKQVSKYLDVNSPGPIDIHRLKKNKSGRDGRLQAVMEATLMAQRGIKVPKGYITLNKGKIYKEPVNYVEAIKTVQPHQYQAKESSELLVHRDLNPYSMIAQHEKIDRAISEQETNLLIDFTSSMKNMSNLNVSIVNGDTLDVVNQLAVDATYIFPRLHQRHIYNPAVLNMANKGDKPTSIGGGVATKGSVAQEEEILRRMNLFPVYVKAFETTRKNLTNNGHEIGEFDVLVTPNVMSYGGNMSTGYAPDIKFNSRSMVIAAAGYRLPNIRGDKDKSLQASRNKIMSNEFVRNIVKKKLRIMQAATRRQSDTLVMGALGLGAFIGNTNQPLNEAEKKAYRRINAAIDRVLIEFFYTNFIPLKNVVFAIMVGKETDIDNFVAYRELFIDMLGQGSATKEAQDYYHAVKKFVFAELETVYKSTQFNKHFNSYYRFLSHPNNQHYQTISIADVFAYERNKVGDINQPPVAKLNMANQKYKGAKTQPQKIENVEAMVAYVVARLRQDAKVMLTDAQENILRQAYQQHVSNNKPITSIIQGNKNWRFRKNQGQNIREKITGPMLSYIAGFSNDSNLNRRVAKTKASYNQMLAYINKHKEFSNDLSAIQKRILKFAFYGSGGSSAQQIKSWITANGFHKSGSYSEKITTHLINLIVDYYSSINPS